MLSPRAPLGLARPSALTSCPAAAPGAGQARPHPGRPLLPSAPAVASSSFLPQLSGHPASSPVSPAPRQSGCPVPPPLPLSARFLASSSVMHLLRGARDRCHRVPSWVRPRAVLEGLTEGLHLTLVSRSVLHAGAWPQNHPPPQPTLPPTLGPAVTPAENTQTHRNKEKTLGPGSLSA